MGVQEDLNMTQHEQHILGQKRRLTIKQAEPLTLNALQLVPVPLSCKDWAAEVGPGGVAGCRGREGTAKLLRGQVVTAVPPSVVFRLQPGLAGLSWQLACLHR